MKITLKSLISQHGERSELCLMKNYDPIKRAELHKSTYDPIKRANQFTTYVKRRKQDIATKASREKYIFL